MIVKFVESIVGDESEYPGNADFLLKWLAGTLPAKNSFQEVLIILGGGGNGKSQFFGNVMVQVWGGTPNKDGAMTSGAQFIEPLDPSWWKARTKANAPDEAMFVVRKARMVYTSEAIGFDITKMKQLTGDDTIDTRGMYKERIKFMVGFCPVVYSNDDPDLPSVMSDDEIALSRRCVCIKFPYQFHQEFDRKTGKKKANFRSPEKCVPGVSDMVKNPTVKIPFLDEEVPSVTSRIFVHGIMLYLIELWTDGVGEIVRHSGKIKRTPSIIDWSTELLSGNKVFDEFLASGIISVMPTRLPPPPTDKWTPQAPKANAPDIYVAFVEWAKNLRKTKT